MTSSQALADDPYRPVIVPQCQMYKAPPGDVCGYIDIEDWKAVLRVDAELVHARSVLIKEQEKSGYLALQVRSLQRQIDAYSQTQKGLLERSEKLTNDLIALDRKYQDERVRPRLGSPMAWAVAGISLAALGGFVLAAVVD